MGFRVERKRRDYFRIIIVEFEIKYGVFWNVGLYSYLGGIV